MFKKQAVQRIRYFFFHFILICMLRRTVFVLPGENDSDCLFTNVENILLYLFFIFFAVVPTVLSFLFFFSYKFILMKTDRKTASKAGGKYIECECE